MGPVKIYKEWIAVHHRGIGFLLPESIWYGAEYRVGTVQLIAVDIPHGLVIFDEIDIPGSTFIAVVFDPFFGSFVESPVGVPVENRVFQQVYFKG